MMFTAGYATFGRYRGLPIRWHWSLPVAIALFGGAAIAPMRWLLVVALVLVHEAGHHLMVRHYGLRPIGVDLQGLGGETRWTGQATPKQEIVIAWSGVLAQLAIFALAELGFALYALGGGAVIDGTWLADSRFMLREANILMVAVNLLPLPTFDGHVAWKLFALWRGDLEPQRVIIIHLDPSRVQAEHELDVQRVQREVEAELEALTRAHNAKAEVGPRE